MVRARILTVVIAGAWLAACSTSPPSQAPVSLDEYLAELLQGAREAGSAEQVAVLEDGNISDDEYRYAIEAALDCMEDGGLEPSPMWIDPLNGLTWQYEVRYPDPNVGEAVFNGCYLMHAEFVERGFFALNSAEIDSLTGERLDQCSQPDPGARIDEAVIACLLELSLEDRDH